VSQEAKMESLKAGILTLTSDYPGDDDYRVKKFIFNPSLGISLIPINDMIFWFKNPILTLSWDLVTLEPSIYNSWEPCGNKIRLPRHWKNK
jgi:hypothetical protein